jgi:hypothetical protein
MAGENGPTLRPCIGKSRAAGWVADRPTLKACPSKRKADGAHMSGWMNGCTSKKKADQEDEAAGSFEPPEKLSGGCSTMVACGEEIEAPTKVKIVMSHEGIESILSHKARTDSFKEFQARVAKEVEETGEFEVSEEYIKNVSESFAWMNERFSTARSRYPDLDWEESDEEEE